MSFVNWQTSDGVTLKSLRQSAGMGLSVLARKASLSTEQLKQLEDGGSHLFYSEAIKLRAGERVLAILGFKFKEPTNTEDNIAQDLVESFYTTPTTESSPHNALSQTEQDQSLNLPSPMPVQVAKLKKTSMPIEGLLVLQGQKRIIPADNPPQNVLGLLKDTFAEFKNIALNVKRISTREPSSSFSPSVVCESSASTDNSRSSPLLGFSSTATRLWRSQVFWITLSVCSVSLLSYDAYLHRTLRVENRSQLWTLNEASISQASMHSPSHTSSTSSISSSPFAMQPSSPELRASPANPMVAVEETVCRWQPQSPTLTVQHPNKQGNYVHVIASTEATLCVEDARHKVSVLKLNQASAQSVYGAPPFKLYSERLDRLKFYYQGYMIAISAEVKDQFTLLEIPVGDKPSNLNKTSDQVAVN